MTAVNNHFEMETDDNTSSFVYGFLFNADDGVLDVYVYGRLVYSTFEFNNAQLFSTYVFEVRVFGNVYSLYAHELGGGETHIHDYESPEAAGVDTLLYPTYVIETDEIEPYTIQSCSTVCINEDDGTIAPPAIAPAAGFGTLRYTDRLEPDGIFLKFDSSDVASFFGGDIGPQAWVPNFAPHLNVNAIAFPEPYSGVADLNSLLVVCDEPFRLRSHVLDNALDATGQGVYSILAVVTPDDPEAQPISWVAPYPQFMRLNNVSPELARRFRFRLLRGNGAPLELADRAYMTILVRGG